ncbi:MAG: twin-arginine translocase TatA/TatE family subunit [Acidimicrobiales bacterium]
MLSTIFSGWDDLIVVVVAVVLLFGGTQLPKLARNTGEALREFRKGHTGDEATPDGPSAAPAAQLGLPPAQEVTGPQAPVPGAGGDVTLTRAELDALLAKAAARGQGTGATAES